MEFDATVNIDGDKIRKLREDNKVTQLYLATAVGVTTDTISRWENRRYPSIMKENALKLAEALEVSLETLLATPETSQALSDENKAARPTAPEHPPAAVVLEGKTGGGPRPLRVFLIPLLCLGLAALAYPLLKTTVPGLNAIRYLPDHVLAGQSFPVLIEVSTGKASGATLMLREFLPAHGSPLGAVPPLVGKEEHLVKWISKMDGSGRNSFVYLVRVGEDTEIGRRLSFQGNLLVGRRGNDAIEVAGDRDMEVSVYHWADENRDNRIDDYELLSVYEFFPNFQELGLDLAEIEKIWAAGGYRWRAETKTVEIMRNEHRQESAGGNGVTKRGEDERQ